MTTIRLERAQWLGYRWHQHCLGGGADLDALLTLGFQDSRQQGQLQALSQRTDTVAGKSIQEAITPIGPLVSCWSLRGAPHAHRASTLDLLASALAPRATDDGGAAYVNVVQTVAAAIKETVIQPMTKAELSTRVASMVPASLIHYCARCKADHVDDGLFRVAGMQAQIVIGPMDGRAMTVCPRPDVRQESAKTQPRL